MPAGTSFGSDAGTQGRQFEPQRILPPQRTPACSALTRSLSGFELASDG
jgi:hypothetical protein